MLQTLTIQNVALIKNATITFDKLLNVISGETGAGKSIMLDSLGFVFGGRADRTLIRSGEQFMKVDAVFTDINSKQKDYIFSQFNINCDDELFLSRELDLSGRNVCKINGELVPVAVVKKICAQLVDIHGQSEHLAILNNDYQLEIVDMFDSSIIEIKQQLEKEIEEYKNNQKQINSLGGNEKEKQNLLDLYQYQINEIENANIKENELEELLNEKKEMQQFEKISETLSAVGECFNQSGYDESAISKISQAKKFLQQISEFSNNYKSLYERLESCYLELTDIADSVGESLDKLNFDQSRFDFVDSRIDYLKSLFRKYGGDYESVIKYKNETETKLNNLLNSEEIYKQLVEEKEKIFENIQKVQEKLTISRKKSANKLKIELEKELKTLGMPDAKFDIKFERISEDFSLSGADYVEFMFSSNVGFELKPLNKVVSGGEMSRVVLAYKIVVSKVDEIHTIVFDEIDTGLSGNIALTVAEYLARLSLNKQIIAISHLPQICAMADSNIRVEKATVGDTTISQSISLTGESLFKEIVRLMGAKIDDSGLKVANELKNFCNEYKSKLK